MSVCSNAHISMRYMLPIIAIFCASDFSEIWQHMQKCFGTQSMVARLPPFYEMFEGVRCSFLLLKTRWHALHTNIKPARLMHQNSVAHAGMMNYISSRGDPSCLGAPAIQYRKATPLTAEVEREVGAHREKQKRRLPGPEGLGQQAAYHGHRLSSSRSTPPTATWGVAGDRIPMNCWTPSCQRVHGRNRSGSDGPEGAGLQQAVGRWALRLAAGRIPERRSL